MAPARRRAQAAEPEDGGGGPAKRARTGAGTTSARSAPASLALVEPSWRRHALYEEVTLENREVYFGISARPLTKRVEDDMELVSDVVSHEGFRDFWASGTYTCARCDAALYSSKDKFRGPCVWPSFRREAHGDALIRVKVDGYNGYTCAVFEVYCAGCELFLGHAFEDGKQKGDLHPDAQWRH
ncbi:Methionine-R-sulfoxide reductase B1 [Hondaea fermentalgiana]|uniref:peptide-methionine (R)-S-oxide reductase n=1 Tax=Hondaea fermentalgiana TaxID=2315210 RepID=A0A2R5GPW0_9STRA|nr:Methionine-R-sulfoxide reductase B1 [Hondaea fermentalgiana]|eukprot:GBG32916.1 Methionine-R-sulfoxide reductase B1 [Hondaea fermentalgiana]